MPTGGSAATDAYISLKPYVNTLHYFIFRTVKHGVLHFHPHGSHSDQSGFTALTAPFVQYQVANLVLVALSAVRPFAAPGTKNLFTA